MKTADEILNSHANARMLKWKIDEFKKTHPKLSDVILASMKQFADQETKKVTAELDRKFKEWENQRDLLEKYHKLFDAIKNDLKTVCQAIENK